MQYIPKEKDIARLRAIIQAKENMTGITPTTPELAALYGRGVGTIRAIIRAMGGLYQLQPTVGRTWRASPAYPNFEVSDAGEVRRLTPTIKCRAGSLLHQRTDVDGYIFVNLCLFATDSRTYRVNRLVCEAFHGPAPSEHHQAAHINGIKDDNRPENLQWKTAKENDLDKDVHGTRQAGVKNGRAKLSEADVKDIRGLLMGGHTRSACARSYNVDPGAISRIALGKSWVSCR